MNTSLAASGLWRNDPSRASWAQGWGPWLELPRPDPQSNAGSGGTVLLGTQSDFLKLPSRRVVKGNSVAAGLTGCAWKEVDPSP